MNNGVRWVYVLCFTTTSFFHYTIPRKLSLNIAALVVLFRHALLKAPTDHSVVLHLTSSQSTDFFGNGSGFLLQVYPEFKICLPRCNGNGAFQVQFTCVQCWTIIPTG